jgi:hypothetical protein
MKKPEQRVRMPSAVWRATQPRASWARSMRSVDASSSNRGPKWASSNWCPLTNTCGKPLRRRTASGSCAITGPSIFPVDVLVALESQETPFPFSRPPNWLQTPSPAAVQRWGDLRLPIQFVLRPPYASWCNPIEKLWRKLKQDVLHLHRRACDLQA